LSVHMCSFGGGSSSRPCGFGFFLPSCCPDRGEAWLRGSAVRCAVSLPQTTEILAVRRGPPLVVRPEVQQAETKFLLRGFLSIYSRRRIRVPEDRSMRLAPCRAQLGVCVSLPGIFRWRRRALWNGVVRGKQAAAAAASRRADRAAGREADAARHKRVEKKREEKTRRPVCTVRLMLPRFSSLLLALMQIGHAARHICRRRRRRRRRVVVVVVSTPRVLRWSRGRAAPLPPPFHRAGLCLTAAGCLLLSSAVARAFVRSRVRPASQSAANRSAAASQSAIRRAEDQWPLLFPRCAHADKPPAVGNGSWWSVWSTQSSKHSCAARRGFEPSPRRRSCDQHRRGCLLLLLLLLPAIIAISFEADCPPWWPPRSAREPYGHPPAPVLPPSLCLRSVAARAGQRRS
jgi:hypothetical protein